ncbi:hypothetical protein EC988_002994 [Linderina pennispora]|nr:hypothetical protein EC988_002994 [Linderina pennispora]
MHYRESVPVFANTDAPNLSTYMAMDGDQEMKEKDYMPLCNLLTNAFHNSTKGGDVVLSSAYSQDNAEPDDSTATGHHSSSTIAAAGSTASEGELGLAGDPSIFKLAMSGGFAPGDVAFLNNLIGIPGDQTHHDIFGSASESLSKGTSSNLSSDTAAGNDSGSRDDHASDGAEPGSGFAFVSVPSSSPSQDMDLLRLMQASVDARDLGDKQGLLNAAAAASAALTSEPNGVGTPALSEEHLAHSSQILAQILSPPEYLASAKSALKTNPPAAGLSAPHHSLASPLVFSTSALFGDAKSSYLLDSTHGGY